MLGSYNDNNSVTVHHYDLSKREHIQHNTIPTNFYQDELGTIDIPYACRQYKYNI